MAQAEGPKHRRLRQVQALRAAALQALARERVLREALDAFDPQPDDRHLEYGELLDRLSAVLEKERWHRAE